MLYLKKLLEEAAALTAKEMAPEDAPQEKLRADDQPLGTVPKEAQLFYYLFIKRAKVLNVRIVEVKNDARLLEVKGELTPEKKRELDNLLNQFIQQRDRIQALFWDGIKEQVPGAYGAQCLALRKNWQVVEQAPEPEVPRRTIIPLEIAALLGAIAGRRCGDPECPVCREPQPTEPATPGN